MDKLIVNILITFAISLAFIGLIYFILNKAFIRKGIRTRFFINLFFGLVLFFIFVISFVVDYKGGNILGYYRHLVLIIVSFIYPFIILLYFIKRIKYTNIRIIRPKTNRNNNLFLYILFKYKEGYLLIRKKDLYRGYIYKIKKSFHDEALEEVFTKLSFDVMKKQYRGKINNKGKIYYCYLINVENIISGFEEINMYELVNLKVEDFDKQAILSIILKEDFNISIWKKRGWFISRFLILI